MSMLFKPRETRQKVVLPARMRAGAGAVDVCIRDVSSRGMLIQAGVPPPTAAAGALVTAPVGTKSVQWVKTLKPDILQDPQIKTFGQR